MSYKNKILLAMKESFTPTEYNDIIEMFNFIDCKVSSTGVDGVYKNLYVSHEFRSREYPLFKECVERCIRNLKGLTTERDKEIQYLIRNLGFYDLHAQLLRRIEKIFPNLSEQQQYSLAYDIAWSIHKYMDDKDNIDGLIAAYKDIKVLRDIKKEVLKIKAQENLEKGKKDKEDEEKNNGADCC